MTTDATQDVKLLVNGRRYSGFKSIRVTRTIESIAGSFALEVSDRWSAEEAWPIVEEDACRVEVEGETVIDGYVERIDVAATKDSRTLAYSGRDRAGALVDSSALLQSWTLRN